MEGVAADPAAGGTEPVSDDQEREEEQRSASAFDERRAERGTRWAVGEVAAGVEGVLPAAVGGGEGDEDGVAPRGGEDGALDGEQIFDSQSAAGPVEAAGDTGGGGCGPPGQGGSVDLVEVVGDEDLSVLGG